MFPVKFIVFKQPGQTSTFWFFNILYSLRYYGDVDRYIFYNISRSNWTFQWKTVGLAAILILNCQI